jgi:DNA-directed RNA polymerase specialized sigma24 family protein
MKSRLNKIYDAYLQDPEQHLESLLAEVRRVARFKFTKDEDGLQVFLVRVWKRLPTLKLDGMTFSGWVYRQAVWRSVDSYTNLLMQAERLWLVDPFVNDETGQSLTQGQSLETLAQMSLDEVADFPYDLETIADPAIRKIAECLLMGYTQAETADILGISPAALRKRLQRYREHNNDNREVLRAA